MIKWMTRAWLTVLWWTIAPLVAMIVTWRWWSRR